LADQVFITDENPRKESPERIRKEILSVCSKATEVADRAQAIAEAIDVANKGDIILLAGKGHEQVQVIGDQTLPFNDAEVAKSLLMGKALLNLD